MEPIEISPAEVAEALQGDAEIVLLDCREADEVQIASIAGAVHVPMQNVPDRLDSIEKDKPLIVFCHRGMRSRRVAEFLRDRGFAGARSMSGGIAAWSRTIDPSVPQY
jgi:rhodanese-related sulfurtransferase